MEKLIAELEAASEGSRELDAAIWQLADPKAFKLCESNSRALGNRDWTEDEAAQQAHSRAKRFAPAYTTSPDAALTLVPEDPANPGKPMLWSVSYDEDGVAGPRGYCAALGKGYHGPQFIYGHSAKSPALALCIAALKSRLAAGAQR